jgi:hypothetical protein
MKKNEFRVIVTGGAEFTNLDLVRVKLNLLLSDKKNVAIVSGQSTGADRMGEIYAYENELKTYFYPPLWQEYGNQSEFIRNEEMAKVAHACICFWDGESVSTKHMIDTAKSKQIPLRVINY